jgi:PhnB protein
MSRVSIYLNFMGKTEEAFRFYKSVFGTEFDTSNTGGGDIMYMNAVPSDPSQPQLPEAEQNAVMHVALPILGGTTLMGTDMLESMGHKLALGNNMSINLEPDTREETDKLFAALSEDGSEVEKLQEMFWGAYWGACVDKYGIRWMFNCAEKKS